MQFSLMSPVMLHKQPQQFSYISLTGRRLSLCLSACLSVYIILIAFSLPIYVQYAIKLLSVSTSIYWPTKQKWQRYAWDRPVWDLLCVDNLAGSKVLIHCWTQMLLRLFANIATTEVCADALEGYLQWTLDNSNWTGPPKKVWAMKSLSYELCSPFALAMWSL